jgi:hypothetical protein
MVPDERHSVQHDRQEVNRQSLLPAIAVIDHAMPWILEDGPEGTTWRRG